MAGYRTSTPLSDKGVYIGQARHAVKELITSLRGELATLEAVYAMMCQGAESTDVREEPQDTGEDAAETAQPSREDPSEVSVADEDPSSENARPGIGTRTLGPPRNGSMRDAILTLLCAAQEAMSITDIAAAVRPGADATVRSSVGKTLNRMKQLGEVENVAPGMFRAVLSSQAA
ncbi:hypothetical protein ABZV73_08535 [Streptomyces albidoflavus]|uniref:Uncharacterized protein n=2 Tax=Streptomyces albidoflavus group TaxID=1477431 RepID=A0ABY3H105_9ACTN|nr:MULTISPECIES: hypothetical protein [Streptomyces albidoflavus group]TWV26185.1 hypothetical protein FRZ02_05655 [Streptomyces albidoflavus]